MRLHHLPQTQTNVLGNIMPQGFHIIRKWWSCDTSLTVQDFQSFKLVDNISNQEMMRGQTTSIDL